MNASAPVALSVKNIHKSFGDHHVLKGISLDAHEGDVISILGASGSGKSTFLRCLNLLETPDDGSVAVLEEIDQLILFHAMRGVVKLRIGMDVENLLPHGRIAGDMIGSNAQLFELSHGDCLLPLLS